MMKPKELSLPIRPPGSVNEHVIFIPGAMGTRLGGKDKKGVFRNAWIPDFLNLFQCMNMLSSDADGRPLHDLQPLGVLMEAPFDYFSPIVKAIKASGRHVHVFPYDFRQDFSVTAETQLVPFIDGLGVPKVSIVALCIGGLVATKYLQTQKHKVDKFVSIATPFFGTPRNLFLAETGEICGKPFDYVGAPVLQKLMRNWPAAYQCFPNHDYFEMVDDHYIVTRPQRAQEKAHWCSRLLSYEADWSDEDDEEEGLHVLTSYKESMAFLRSREWANHALLGKGERFIAELKPTETLKDVDVYYFVGYNVSTLHFMTEVLDDTGHVVSFRAHNYLQGDGTVPMLSQNMGGKCEELHPNRCYYIDCEHTAIPTDSAALQQILNILDGRPDDVVAPISRQFPKAVLRHTNSRHKLTKLKAC